MWFHKEISLDLPVSPENPTQRLQLLKATQGDFQNSVCFWDYLEHLERDVNRLARRLIDGDSAEEIQVRYHWNQQYYSDIYDSLSQSMERYWAI